MDEGTPGLPGAVVVVSHGVMIDGQDNFGPAHNVVDFMVGAGIDVDFNVHPLEGSGSGVRRSFRDGALVEQSRIRYGPLGRVREALYNVDVGARHRATALLLIDPLSCATVALPRRLLRRRGVIVYYTADYADRRFANRFLNWVYHGMDRLALRQADVVWNVSQRITEKRRTQGVDDKNNVHVPNSPAFDPGAILPLEARDPESVVMVGALDRVLDERLLLDSLERLQENRPRFRATIIGTGKEESRFRLGIRQRGLDGNVVLTGYLPRPEALSIVRRSRVGLALYSGRAAWTAYCDSVKVREYLSLGVPVVTTPNHGIASEVAACGAGVLVDSAADGAAAIDTLLGPSGSTTAERAAEMARIYDRDTILHAALDDVTRRLG
jgi:glycosyltransferase involved in cell wall biosynthesis